MRAHQQFCLAMMMAVTLASSTSLALAARPSTTYKGHELASEAKLTIAQARQIAQSVRKGRITDEELEHEAGGSGLRYTFDILDGKVGYEVGVDAATGDILENQQEAVGGD